ncbi:helix-turn-helix domain-containing protein [Neisseria sp. HMSC064D07]|uniref:helix-turn-helix domain-containing protein n=1 Tax=Neisseria sp. HMSC064D07 TaxID=1715087 RepID=UPI0008A8C305|nr:helix-turn-helix domain-containing protein [Neisseria sp. HMSC064D07]OHQ08640.1 DNA-binding protein [Neisseria sp. HMSC064D07]
MKFDCINNKPKTPSQRERVLARLRKGSVTSWELSQMGILGYNSRIMELRRAGHEIITVMEDVKNQFGETVKRGRFSLLVSERSKS